MIYKNVNASNLTQDVYFYWNLKKRSTANVPAEASVETKENQTKKKKGKKNRAENSHRIHLNVMSKAHSNTPNWRCDSSSPII